MLHPIHIIAGDFEISTLNAEDLAQFDRIAHDVFEILSDDKTLHFIPEKRLYNIIEAETWLQSSVLNFHAGRNFIFLIRESSTSRIVGIVNILSPAIARENYKLATYPHFIEFYLKGDYQGSDVMSNILPKVIKHIKKQNITELAAAANRRNFAAKRVLEKSGFINVGFFDLEKDLYNVVA